jgi:hypothetical protein
MNAWLTSNTTGRFLPPDLLPGLIITAVGVVFAVFILRSIFKNVRLWQMARSSRDWPAVDGEVVNKRLEAYARHRTPVIEYTYLVRGVRYAGNRLRFDTDSLYIWTEAEAILDRYKVGQAITVYYDANDPQESTLERRPRGIVSSLLLKAFLLFFPTGFCLLIGLFALADAFGLIK